MQLSSLPAISIGNNNFLPIDHPLEDYFGRLVKFEFSIIYEPFSSRPESLKSGPTTPSVMHAEDIGRFSIELGASSMNLVDIHLCCPLSKKLANHFLPSPQITGRGPTGSKCHYVYRTSQTPGPSIRLAVPVGPFAEYRTTGLFELFLPSPNSKKGMPLEVSGSGWPPFHQELQLTTQLSWMAVCAALYPFFRVANGGSLTELIVWSCGTLAGLFATYEEVERVIETLCKVSRKKYSQDLREAFIRGIGGLTQDDDPKGRLKALVGVEAMDAITRYVPQRPPPPVIQF